MNDDDDTKMMI
jgi:hypothetical protein